MEIKDLIKTRRLQRGMTMRELAEKIGNYRSMIQGLKMRFKRFLFSKDE